MQELTSSGKAEVAVLNQPRFRVLIVVAGGLRDPGGVTRCMEYLIDSWSRSPDAPEYQIVDPRGVGSIYLSPWFFAKALFEIVRASGRQGEVIIHANMCEYGSTLRKLPIIALGRVLGARSVIHLHGAEIKTMFGKMPRWLQRCFSVGMSLADRTVVLGDSWQQFVCRDVGLPASKVTVIRNAVPIPAGSRRDLRAQPCLLLYLGRLEDRKGADRLLRALSMEENRHLDWSAVMAGDGDIETYRSLAQQLGLTDRVSFTGWLGRDAVEQLMGQSDVLVLPSLNEGLPMAILEAMAHGLAVVATPVGAIADVIREEQTGLLVPPGDVPALARALRRVINDPVLRLRLGQEARSLVQQECDAAHYGDRFLRLYQQVLREGEGPGREQEAVAD